VPIFEYKAIDGHNKTKRGIIDADTTRDARLKLKRERLFVTDIREARSKKATAIRIRGVTGVETPNKTRIEQVAAVTRQSARDRVEKSRPFSYRSRTTRPVTSCAVLKGRPRPTR
jgi:general secretion pathway protein F